MGILLIATVVGLYILLVAMDISRTSKSRDTEYMVAITGAAGLADLEARDRPTLSPVFNLTVRINNTGNQLERACVGRFSTAAVSYGDAFLARGSVPAFCAEVEQEGERGATAWGQDVVVPRFLRERLTGERLTVELERGEGEVDVQVTTPGSCRTCRDAVLVCKAKIGGRPSPCWEDYVNPRPAPAAGSTSLLAYM